MHTRPTNSKTRTQGHTKMTLRYSHHEQRTKRNMTLHSNVAQPLGVRKQGKTAGYNKQQALKTGSGEVHGLSTTGGHTTRCKRALLPSIPPKNLNDVNLKPIARQRQAARKYSTNKKRILIRTKCPTRGWGHITAKPTKTSSTICGQLPAAHQSRQAAVHQ